MGAGAPGDPGLVRQPVYHAMTTRGQVVKGLADRVVANVEPVAGHRRSLLASSSVPTARTAAPARPFGSVVTRPTPLTHRSPRQSFLSRAYPYALPPRPGHLAAPLPRAAQPVYDNPGDVWAHPRTAGHGRPAPFQAEPVTAPKSRANGSRLAHSFGQSQYLTTHGHPFTKRLSFVT